MKCRQCDMTVEHGTTTCPACNATWSEDGYETTPDSRTDTEYRLALDGHRIIVSRRDLKTFIAPLLLLVVMMAYSLLTLQLRIDGGFYLGVAVFVLAAALIGRRITRRWGMSRNQRLLLAAAVATICLGLAVLVMGRLLLDTLGPEDGSVEYVNNMADEYQSYIDQGFGICIGGVLLGLTTPLLVGKVKRVARGTSR